MTPPPVPFPPSPEEEKHAGKPNARPNQSIDNVSSSVQAGEAIQEKPITFNPAVRSSPNTLLGVDECVRVGVSFRRSNMQMRKLSHAKHAQDAGCTRPAWDIGATRREETRRTWGNLHWV